MNLLRPTTFTMNTKRLAPFHALTVVASLGLLAVLGANAQCAMPAAIAASQQDDDDKKKRSVKIHKHHGDQDENVEVIVMQDGDADHRVVLDRLKKHNIRIHERHGGDDENVEVVVIQGDKQDDSDLHKHVVGLLHGNGSEGVNHKELAKKLREIADQLDGSSHTAHPQLELHQHDVEIHHGGAHKIQIEKRSGSSKPSHRIIEFNTETGKRINLNKTGAPHEMTIELKIDEHGNVHASNDGHRKMILHAKELEPGHNIIVEEIQVTGDDNPQEEKLHFGSGATSDEGGLSAMEKLRHELHQLRQELGQLRSKKVSSGENRLRLIEESKNRLQARDTQAASRVVERLKKDIHANEGEGHKGIFWVEENDDEKSGKRFILKKTGEKDGDSSPNVFRFDLKSDRESKKKPQKDKKK